MPPEPSKAVQLSDFVLQWHPHPIPDGDPIGPWLREALLEEIIDRQDVIRLTQIRVELSKEVINLQRQQLDVLEKSLDAMNEVLRSKG